MFYCEDCQAKNNWPESFSMSRGGCEMCGKMAVCYDTPSSQLPDRKPESDEVLLGKSRKILARALNKQEEDWVAKKTAENRVKLDDDFDAVRSGPGTPWKLHWLWAPNEGAAGGAAENFGERMIKYAAKVREMNHLEVCPTCERRLDAE